MTRKKPVAVFVLGILNIVFGSIGLVLGLCCGLGLVVGIVAIQGFYQQVPPEDQRHLDELWATFSNNVPGLVPLMIGSVVLSFVLAIMQLISGIGLVRIRGWGRWLCVVWAVLQILTIASSMYYEMVYMNPSLQKIEKDVDNWFKKFEEKQRAMGKPAPQRQNFKLGGTGNPLVDNAMSVGFNGLRLAYCGFAFLLLVLPATGTAIARYHGRDDGFSQERQEDLYDEDYLRRRRDLDNPPDSPQPPIY